MSEKSKKMYALERRKSVRDERLKSGKTGIIQELEKTVGRVDEDR